MTRRLVRLTVPALVLLPGLPALIGGWAVTTVEDLPDYAVVGKPLTLTFTVRQHGHKPMDGLRPRVEVVGGEARSYAAASVRAFPGRYSATITLPRAGDWIVTIHSGFGTSRTTLTPMKAIASGSPAPASLSNAAQGRRLFAAKGCVTCHVDMRVGADLSTKRYTTEYVTQVLADPGRVFRGRQGPVSMPNLNLKPGEITALAAYLTANQGVAAAR